MKPVLDVALYTCCLCFQINSIRMLRGEWAKAGLRNTKLTRMAMETLKVSDKE